MEPTQDSIHVAIRGETRTCSPRHLPGERHALQGDLQDIRASSAVLLTVRRCMSAMSPVPLIEADWMTSEDCTRRLCGEAARPTLQSVHLVCQKSVRGLPLPRDPHQT